MKKIFSLLMAVVLLVSALPVAYAAEGEHDYSNGTQITLVGTQENQGAQWTVTVPAKMQPGQTGTVTASGTWAADKYLQVSAPNSITLTYGAQSMDIGITFGRMFKIGSSTEEVTASKDITVAEASRLFGTWTGTIVYTVDLKVGDMNMDGIINEDDHTLLKAYQLGKYDEIDNLTDELRAHLDLYGDTDGDGTFDAQDVMQHRAAVLNG